MDAHGTTMTTQPCFFLALRTVAVAVALFGGNAAMAQFAQTPIDITSQITTLVPYSNRIEYHYQTATVLLRNTFGQKDEDGNVIPKKLGTLTGQETLVELIRQARAHCDGPEDAKVARLIERRKSGAKGSR